MCEMCENVSPTLVYDPERGKWVLIVNYNIKPPHMEPETLKLAWCVVRGVSSVDIGVEYVMCKKWQEKLNDELDPQTYQTLGSFIDKNQTFFCF